MTEITTPEQQRFHELETIIEEGKDSWIAVGCAIAEIKELKLYRDSFKTFESYCKERWGWGRSYCNRIVTASKVVSLLKDAQVPMVGSKMGTIVPISVHAATALSGVPEEERPTVIAKATPPGGGPITARAIKAASPPPRKTPQVAQERPKDSTGLPIPAALVPIWERSGEVQELLTYISAIRSKLRRFQDDKDPLFVGVNFSSVISNLDQAYQDIKVAKPYAVCPSCQGKVTEDCGACNGIGLVSEFFWNTCVPTEVKALRGK